MASFPLLTLVPLLVLLAIPELDNRKVWLLLPLVYVADLDYFVGVHREWLHNVWTLVPSVGVVTYAFHEGRRELAEWGVIATAYLASHLVMDVFLGGETLFWPISNWNVCYYFAVNVRTATNTPVRDMGSCSAPGAPIVSALYTWWSYSDTAVWAVALLALAVLLGYRWWRRRGADA